MYVCIYNNYNNYIYVIIHVYLFIVFLEMMTNEIAGKASPVSTAGFISDHRVLYLIYKSVVYFDGSPY